MGFLSDGKKKEKYFAEHLENVEFSNEECDMLEHWDLKTDLKYDVKGLKKISRSDITTNEFYHFLEIKNVNGKLGWLYGEADCFAFETNEYWIIVDKIRLQDLVKEKVKKTWANSSDECLYCLYKREGRLDVITLVKTIDLMIISKEIITKKIDIITHKIGDSIYEEKNLKKRIEELFKKGT